MFGPGTFTNQQVNSIVRYVEYLREPQDPGGFSLGLVGPITEGLIAILVGLGALMLITRWIEPRGGAMREFFTSDWAPAADQGSRAEPGHQYEWAWLLLRYGRYAGDVRIIPVALRLIEFGEKYGVDPVRHVAINACLDNGAPVDRTARLWPQAERIKAGCLAGEMTGEPRYFRIAVEATRVLTGYLDTPLQGLWRDRMQEDGRFVVEPAPASSFYHIVSAAAELKRVSDRG